MPTSTYASAPLHILDTDFRAWGSALSASIAACLTQTTDTGQINWTTVTKPGSAAYGGYEIFRFNDTLQATAPIFLKVEYGSQSTATNPAIRVSVGRATDGAGTLSSLALSAVVITPTSRISGVSARNTYACYADGCFWFCWALAATAAECGAFLLIDRSRDAAGAATTEGIAVYWTTGSTTLSNTNIGFWAYPAVSAVGSSATTAPALLPQSMTTTVIGADVAVLRHYRWQPGLRATGSVVSHAATEIGAETSFAVPSFLGRTRTFLSLPRALAPAALGSFSIAALAALWEA